MSGVSPEDLQAFVQIFEDSDWDEVELRVGDLELHLSKSASSVRVTRRMPDRSVAGVVSSPEKSGTGVDIHAPHVGTFFRSPNPKAAAYVEAGDLVDDHSVVCRLEVMNRSVEIKAGVGGFVSKICVDDGVLVEGGQVLFVVDSRSI